MLENIAFYFVATVLFMVALVVFVALWVLVLCVIAHYVPCTRKAIKFILNPVDF